MFSNNSYNRAVRRADAVLYLLMALAVGCALSFVL